MAQSKSKGWLKKLRNKYRLVVLNDETYEEELSMMLSRLNVYMVVSGIILVSFIATILIIAFTPLKIWITGYDEVKTKKLIAHQRIQIDSLLSASASTDFYIQNLRNIIGGEVDFSQKTINQDESDKLYDDIDYGKDYPNDSLFRLEMDQEYMFRMEIGRIRNENSNFFAPVKGLLTNHFDVSKSHFGVDIVAPENAIIKAVLPGKVIFAEKTFETGWVTVIQHKDNFISIYKHNSLLLKKTGNFVDAGDVIAVIGNTGELTTGPHLHFELWHNSMPVNPNEYINFD